MTDLNRFTQGFKKALRLEWAAMHQQLGSFAVLLLDGRPNDASGLDKGERCRYSFGLPAPSEKLIAPMDCTLRQKTSEYLVKVIEVRAR